MLSQRGVGTNFIENVKAGFVTGKIWRQFRKGEGSIAGTGGEIPDRMKRGAAIYRGLSIHCIAVSDYITFRSYSGRKRS
jgi:hypothetical protein